MTVELTDNFALLSRVDRVDGARRWAGNLARSAGVDEEAISELELALTEALSNVIRHAYSGDATGRIDLSLSIDDQRMELMLRETGRQFDADRYRPPNLDVPGTSNYGVHLIGQLMDEVHRHRDLDGANILSLVKYREE